MNLGFILLVVFFVYIFGVLPMLLTIPINGLTIWGQILGLLKVYDQALFMWFISSAILIFASIGLKLVRRRAINTRHFKTLLELFVPWILFCIYLIVNYLLLSHNGADPIHSMDKIILLILKGIVPAFFISVWLLLNKKNTNEKIEKAIIGFGIIQIYFVIQAYLSGDAFRRMTIFGLNPIWLARDLGISILAALSIFKNRILRFSSITILTIGIILTRSRGPLIALVIILFIVYSYKLLISKKYKQLAPSLIVISLLVIFLIVGVGMADYFIRGGASFLEEGNVSSRIGLYQAAWSDFLESPILGKGMGSYFHHGHSYPHNIILELLAETGLIGFVLFIIALRPKNMFNSKNVFSVYMLFALITSLFSGDLEKNSFLMIFSILSNFETLVKPKT